MQGYFEHIGNKVYLHNYPETIINLDTLTQGIIVEFASGTCNDAKWMLEQLGINSGNLFLIECDTDWFTDGLDKLEGCSECPYYGSGTYICHGEKTEYCRTLPKVEFSDVLYNKLPGLLADFVYANNCLHDFGILGLADRYEFFERMLQGEDVTKDIAKRKRARIKKGITEAYRLLKSGGIFFGRTLSDYINHERLGILQSKSDTSEKEAFVLKTAQSLQRGILTGLSSEDFTRFAKEAGFSATTCLEITPEDWVPVMDFYFRCEK